MLPSTTTSMAVIATLISSITCVITSIDLNQPYTLKPLSQIWTSTGFCPPAPHKKFKTYIELDSLKQNIAMIGDLPYRHQMFQVRVHWMLDLVMMKSSNYYDFQYLDKFVKLCYDSGLSIGFELMGNPGNYYSDFENRTQVVMWQKLIYTTVQRYSHLHWNWNYELWNEPDHGDFDGLNFTVQGYLNYVDASEKGVHDADRNAKFGGPGASCRLSTFSKLCWAFMDHITTGVNYFTKKVGTRVDFISFHKKGGKRGEAGNSTLLYQAESDTLQYMLNHYKQLISVLFYNDEGDPVTGWSQPMEFRADLRYPCMVLRLIHIHLYSDSSDFQHYKMTSNDNAFLSFAPSYFTQRTMLATFTINNTAVPYTVLVRKPIYELMTLLSQVRGSIIVLPNTTHDISALTGYILSRTDHQIVVSAWASNDTNAYLNGSTEYMINLPSDMLDGYYIIRQMNKSHLSTYDIWTRLGYPGNLSRLDTELLWNNSMVAASRPTKIQRSIKLAVTGPGVTQLIACNRLENLTIPNRLTFHNISVGLVTVRWEDEQLSDCFLTYELQIRRYNSDKFLPINNGLLLTRAYQFTSEYGVIGEYRVRSRNILGQTSKYSNIYWYQK